MERGEVWTVTRLGHERKVIIVGNEESRAGALAPASVELVDMALWVTLAP